MKKFLFTITLFATLALWGSCTQEETNQGEYAFTGTVVDAASGEPKENVPVMVTNGMHIYTSTKTDANGMFKLYINIYKINNQYYILIGDETTEQKRVEIRGFSSYETNLGTFEIQGQGKPVVEMGSCNVGKETIVCTASITNDGYLEIDEKGFCFGKTPRPSVDDIKVVCGSGKDNFIAEVSLSKFDKSSNYYVRPYAKNSKGIGYGKEVSFTTQEGLPIVETLNAENVKASSATIGGNLIENGGFKVYERGVCWDTDGTPDIDGNHKYINGNENGEYWIDVDGLKTNTKYYACAYAKNENGVSYGRIIEFTTNEDGFPSVVSLEAKNIKATSASLGGRLINNGGYEVTERGVCWDIDGTPSLDDNYKFIDGQETIDYWINVDGLDPSTKYYVRAYAKNKHGVAYGNIKTFTTKNGYPTVETTQLKYGITELECYGNVTDDGGFSIIKRGFCYSTHSKPTLDDEVVLSTSNTVGEYCLTIDNLEEGTTYYVRAFVENDMGVSYGDIKYATTLVTTTFRVVDTDNTPVPGATIYFGSTSTSYKCDNNGQLQLTSYVGTFKTFWASADGYNDSEKYRDKPVNKYNKEYTITLSLIPVSISPETFSYSCTQEGQFGTKKVSTLTIKNHSRNTSELYFKNVPNGINISSNKGYVNANESLNIDITFVYPGPSVPNSLKYNVLLDSMTNKPYQWLWIYDWDDIDYYTITSGVKYRVTCRHTIVLVIDGITYDIPITFETSVNIRN